MRHPRSSSRLYDGWSRAYGLTRRPFARCTPAAHRALDAELLGATDLDVLDLGAGTGYVARRLATLDVSVASYVAVDASVGMLRRCRGPARSVTTRAELRVGSVDEEVAALAAAGREFDRVVGVLLLSHLVDPRQLVRSAESLLRPGGRSIWLFFAASGPVWIRLPVRGFLGLLGARPPAADVLDDGTVADHRSSLAGALRLVVRRRATPGSGETGPGRRP